jgi:hypothetical protein
MDAVVRRGLICIYTVERRGFNTHNIDMEGLTFNVPLK